MVPVFIPHAPDEFRAWLDAWVDCFNRPEFIAYDPISIPHFFSLKQDIEIAGFFAATLAWGQRKTLIANAQKLVALMDLAPYDFVLHHSPRELLRFKNFVHRTFSAKDAVFFIQRLRKFYHQYSDMEQCFAEADDVKSGLLHFRALLLSHPLSAQHSRHVSNPEAGSAAKRLNMFLRWMVRNDNRGVDFGLWKKLSPAALFCPLDVHSGKVARQLGLLKRSQNDWKAVEELTAQLRLLDPKDPAKYDFALFGLGAFAHKKPAGTEAPSGSFL